MKLSKCFLMLLFIHVRVGFPRRAELVNTQVVPSCHQKIGQTHHNVNSLVKSDENTCLQTDRNILLIHYPQREVLRPHATVRHGIISSDTVCEKTSVLFYTVKTDGQQYYGMCKNVIIPQVPVDIGWVLCFATFTIMERSKEWRRIV